MRIPQIEAWVISIVDRVIAGQLIEDSRIELKSEWPDPRRAARRIAGHANAAGGDSILWIIGVDEKARKVVGADLVDLANWYKSVRAEFDSQLAPAVRDVAVPYDDKTVIALLFETIRAPFVVKNPSFGQKGEVVQWEVPWRDHTSIRSATRADLIRLLTPMQTLPSFELLSAHLECASMIEPMRLQWNMLVKGYVVAISSGPVVLPFHRCTGSVTIEPWMIARPIGKIYLHPDGDDKSLMIKKGPSEVVIDGAGTLQISAIMETRGSYPYQASPAHIQLKLQPANNDAAIPIDIALTVGSFSVTQDGSSQDRLSAMWVYSPNS